LKDKILHVAHNSPLASRSGYLKTYRQIRERFAWKGLKIDVLKFVQECHICQQNKEEHTRPAGLLQPLPIPEQKWESILMDFITRLPQVQGKDCIYVMVESLTKFAHLFSMSSKYSTTQVAELFFKEVFQLHGLPKTIVNDRDSRFMGGFWQDLFKLVGAKLTPSTSYYPQTDGQTEIVNKWLKGYLRNYVSRQLKAWIKWLHFSEHCYNTTYHMSIGMTPFKALYGYDATTFVDQAFGDSRAPKAKDWIQETPDILRTLKDNLQTAQNQQKMYVDKHRVERSFEVGDLLYLHFQPYMQSSLKMYRAEKLKPRFYGPYRISVGV
jgi:hypothetical protein